MGEALVDRAVLGESAEVRRVDLAAITREMIGAQRVDHDEDHVRLVREGRGDARALLAGRGGRGEDDREESADADDADQQQGD